MRNSAGELAKSIHLLGLPELLFHLTAFGHVAGYLGKTNDLASFIMNGINDDAGPKTRTVLANPPVLLFETPSASGSGECFLRDPGEPIFFRIEARKVLPDDLRTRIAFDSFCSWVPVGDMSFSIEHENCVVDDALHQHPKRPLARLELVSRVTDNLRPAFG